MNKTCITLLALLCLLPAVSADGQSLRIGTREDWEQWSYPEGTLEITPGGLVEVRQVRKNNNPVLDATTFEYSSPVGPAVGGIRSVGSNPWAADHVLDGDPLTSWSPRWEDPVEDWWIEIDLGRAVVAEELRLIFAEHAPVFSEFRLFVSTGELRYPGTDTKTLLYEPVYQTLGPNDLETVTLEFQETDDLGNPLTGRIFQFIKLIFDRKVEGAALSDVAIRALGQNVAIGTIARGGGATSGQVSSPADIFDGLMWTWWKMTNMGTNWLQGKNMRNGPWVRWDLGAEFFIDTIRLTSSGGALSSSTQAKPPMDGFRIYVSDGTEGTLARHAVWQVEGRNVEWNLVADVNNTTSYPDMAHRFELHYDPPVRARYIFFHHYYGAGIWRTGYALGAQLKEFMLFGEGYLPGVEMESPLLEVGDKLISAIEWEADLPPESGVQIQTRTGDTVEEEIFYYDKNGNQITESKYNSIPSSFRGEIITRRLPVETEWSDWSPPYRTSGAGFQSPTPSQYLLIRAKLASADPAVAPTLDEIVLRLADPAVKRISGRVEPRAAEPGVSTRLQYLLEPQTTYRHPGFRYVLVQTPSPARDVEVEIAGAEVVPTDIRAGDDSLVVSLPRVVRNEEVRVAFSTVIQQDNTVFGGAVASVRGEWQLVDPEFRDALTVRLPLFAETDDLVQGLEIRPAVITPNNDGVNDRAQLSFSVLKLDAPRTICIQIFDLRGERVRTVFDERGTSALYGADGGIAWDGLDQYGNRVPPGTYICRLQISGDAQSDIRQHLLHVAY